MRPLDRRGAVLQAAGQGEVVAIREDGRTPRHQVRVGHEVLDPVLGQHLLDAGAQLPDAAPIGPRGRCPLVAGPIGALREPDAAWGPAEMPPVRLHRGAKLEVDGLVAREQRQVAVGGGTGDDLDVPVALQLGERPRNVAADAPVQLPHPLVDVLPEVRELDGLLDALLLEVLARLPAVAADGLVVERQFLLEVRRGELLDENGERLTVHFGEIPSAMSRCATSRRGR